RLSFMANQENKSLWKVISNNALMPQDINAGARAKIKHFVDLIRNFQILESKMNAYDLVEEIAKTSTILNDLFSDKTPEGIARYDNIQELLNGIKEFVEQENAAEEQESKSLAVFLQDIALLTDADKDKPEDNNKVSLMTIHAAKGLEFP